jgi:hypothetical protein
MGPSRLAEPPPAAQPENAPAAVMPSPPSPGSVGRSEAAAAHPDTTRGCPPPAGATPRAESGEAATAAPAPMVVPKSPHGEGSATSHAEAPASHGKAPATSHGEGPAEAPTTSHSQASATSHGEASATAMRRKAASPCEAPTAVRPAAAHG